MPMTTAAGASHRDRRNFLSLAGKGLGLAALSSATVASLLKDVEAATQSRRASDAGTGGHG